MPLVALAHPVVSRDRPIDSWRQVGRGHPASDAAVAGLPEVDRQEVDQAAVDQEADPAGGRRRARNSRT